MSLASKQARRQRGGRGAMPPRFISCPPLGIFWGGISCCFWPEKTFKFVISARKSLRISAKTFFFGDHLIFTETSPQSDSGIMKKLCTPDFDVPHPPDLAKLATPLPQRSSSSSRSLQVLENALSQAEDSYIF